MWCLVALWLVGLVQQLLGTTFELWVMFLIVALVWSGIYSVAKRADLQEVQRHE